MNRCATPNPVHDISDITKAIMKINDAIDIKMQSLLDENNRKAEAILKGYLLALRDVKWYLENIDKETSSIA